MRKDVPETIASYKKTDPAIDRFFKDSVGYVVFPRIGKVGFIVAAVTAWEKFTRRAVGRHATITMATVACKSARRIQRDHLFPGSGRARSLKQNKFEFTATCRVG